MTPTVLSEVRTKTGFEPLLSTSRLGSPPPQHWAPSDSVKLRAGGGLNDHVLSPSFS